VLPVETQCFAGGLERLLTVVQLLDPEVFPRLALASLQGSITRSAVVVVDWLRGRLDDALSALGGELTPVAAGAFRSGSLGSETDDQRLAMLVIPLGLSGEQLVTGEAARCCVRKFQLALIPTAADDTTQPSALVVRVSSAVPGALLPDGLQLDARQGNHHQSMRSSMSTDIELVFQASDQWLDVSLRYRDGDPIALPSLELPG
jgi:hypothetical protein